MTEKATTRKKVLPITDRLAQEVYVDLETDTSDRSQSSGGTATPQMFSGFSSSIPNCDDSPAKTITAGADLPVWCT
jgi:hypothetical protein